MRLVRPLAAVISMALLAASGPVGYSGSAGSAAGDDSAVSAAVAGRPSVGRSVSVLPEGQQVERRATAVPGKRPQATSDPHTVLVKLRPIASAADRTRLASSVRGKVVGAVTGGYLKITTSGPASDAIALLGKDSAVVSAEPDGVRYLTATPNDPLYGPYQKFLKTIRMPAAWDLQKSATGVIVAVVDTGVDGGHPDLAGRLVAGYNAVTPGASTTDTAGHGTFVSGIIAANTNNKAGVASVTWTGRVMPIKVFVSDTALDSDIAEGITWAVNHGAKVINLSLGGPVDNNVLHDSIKYAVSKGAVVVASAGNTGDGVTQYPAAYPEVISVGATDDAGNLTDFSSFGEHIDIAAPGFDVFSTFPGESDCYPCYGWWSGTSFSAPQVAGVAALLKSKHPSWTPAQIMSQITSTARDAGPRGFDPYYGWGVLDAYAALGGAAAAAFPRRALGANEPNDVPARATSFVPIGSSSFGDIEVEGDADWYKFSLVSDGNLYALAYPPEYSVDRAQNLDVVLDLYDAQLHLLAHADSEDPGATEQIGILVPEGTYYFKVSNFNGAAATYGYALSASFSALPPPAPIPPFTNATLHVTGNGITSAVAVGDMNNDHRLDLLAAGWNFPDTSMLLVSTQRADGTFDDPTVYPTVGNTEPAFAGAVAAVDATGDGKLDAVVGTRSGVEVHAQNAAGTLNPGVNLADVGAVTDLTVADIDGDGDQDIITGGDGVFLLTQGPAGVFNTTQIASADQAGGETVVGDLNNDGRLDIASFGTVLAYAFVVHLNKANGWEHATYQTHSEVPYGIAAADVTGDGLADLVCSCEQPNNDRLAVYEQQPDGTLGRAQEIFLYSTSTVEVADWDVDGRLDVVDGSQLFRQQPDGTLGAGVYSPLDGGAQAPKRDGVVVTDLNGDGHPDLVSAANGLGFVTAYNSWDVPPPPELEIPRGPQAVVMDTSVPDFGTGATRRATKITIKTAATLDPATVNGQTVRLVNGKTGMRVTATVTYNAATGVITLTHAVSLGGRLHSLPLVATGTPYRLIISGVKDTDGATKPGFSLSFTG